MERPLTRIKLLDVTLHNESIRIRVEGFRLTLPALFSYLSRSGEAA